MSPETEAFDVFLTEAAVFLKDFHKEYPKNLQEGY
jgi:hypothetical protein